MLADMRSPALRAASAVDLEAVVRMFGGRVRLVVIDAASAEGKRLRDEAGAAGFSIALIEDDRVVDGITEGDDPVSAAAVSRMLARRLGSAAGDCEDGSCRM